MSYASVHAMHCNVVSADNVALGFFNTFTRQCFSLRLHDLGWACRVPVSLDADALVTASCSALQSAMLRTACICAGPSTGALRPVLRHCPAAPRGGVRGAPACAGGLGARWRSGLPRVPGCSARPSICAHPGELRLSACSQVRYELQHVVDPETLQGSNPHGRAPRCSIRQLACAHVIREGWVAPR